MTKRGTASQLLPKSPPCCKAPHETVTDGSGPLGTWRQWARLRQKGTARSNDKHTPPATAHATAAALPAQHSSPARTPHAPHAAQTMPAAKWMTPEPSAYDLT